MGRNVIAVEGEIVTDGAGAETSFAVRLSEAEINQQIATARRFPRAIDQVRAAIHTVATLDEPTAEEMMYSLPRAGKVIEGPSIRFAEALVQAYGNCRVAARVVEINTAQKYIEAEAVFHDLESNAATAFRIQRRISDSKGRLYGPDMVQQTGNAACSIARRNAILAAVPRALWRPAYEAARQMLVGDIKALANTRAEAVRAFQRFGVTPEQLFAALNVAAEADLTADHIVTLRGMFATLKNGEETPETMFAPARATHQPVADPLADGTDDPARGEARFRSARTEHPL
jgi:hypothetical protein